MCLKIDISHRSSLHVLVSSNSNSRRQLHPHSNQTHRNSCVLSWRALLCTELLMQLGPCTASHCVTGGAEDARMGLIDMLNAPIIQVSVTGSQVCSCAFLRTTVKRANSGPNFKWLLPYASSTQRKMAADVVVRMYSTFCAGLQLLYCRSTAVFWLPVKSCTQPFMQPAFTLWWSDILLIRAPDAAVCPPWFSALTCQVMLADSDHCAVCSRLRACSNSVQEPTNDR